MVLNRNSTPGEFVDIRKCSKVGIIKKKIERKRNHFLSDLFAAAVLLGSYDPLILGTLSNEDDDGSETSQKNDFGSILNRSIRQI